MQGQASDDGMLVLRVSGGTISNNIAHSYGGGISSSRCVVEISGNAIIEENRVHITEKSNVNNAGNGGGINFNQSVLTISGGIIRNNKVTGDKDLIRRPFGAGVYVANGAQFNFTGGTIHNNRFDFGDGNNDVSSAGGNVFIRTSASFNMTGGTISGDGSTVQAKLGGGVAASCGSENWGGTSGTVKITGGTIENCVANAGDAIFASLDVSLGNATINGEIGVAATVIYENWTDSNGNGVYDQNEEFEDSNGNGVYDDGEKTSDAYWLYYSKINVCEDINNKKFLINIYQARYDYDETEFFVTEEKPLAENYYVYTENAIVDYQENSWLNTNDFESQEPYSVYQLDENSLSISYFFDITFNVIDNETGTEYVLKSETFMNIERGSTVLISKQVLNNILTFDISVVNNNGHSFAVTEGGSWSKKYGFYGYDMFAANIQASEYGFDSSFEIEKDVVITIIVPAYLKIDNSGYVSLADNYINYGRTYSETSNTWVNSFNYDDLSESEWSLAWNGIVNFPTSFRNQSVRGIKKEGFANTRISKITIPSFLSYIDVNAFDNCYDLGIISISTTTGCNGMFTDAGVLREKSIVNVGINVLDIPSAYFDGSGITELNFEQNAYCEAIGSYAFNDCSRLKTITLPENLRDIGEYAFYGCVNLETINLNSRSLSNFSGKTSDPSLDNYVFYNAGVESSGISVNVGPYVEKIPAFMFIPSVVLEKNENNEYVKDVNGNNKYQGSPKITTLNLDNATRLSEIKEKAFLGVATLTGHVKFPSPLTLIGSNAFQATGLTSISLENTKINKINSTAFSNCKNLSGEIIMPYTLETIDNYSFLGCSKLKHVDLSNCVNLKNINVNVFQGCSSLESVYIPASVKNLQYHSGRISAAHSPFSGCSSNLVILVGSTQEEVEAITDLVDDGSGFSSYWNYYNSTTALPRTYYNVSPESYRFYRETGCVIEGTVLTHCYPRFSPQIPTVTDIVIPTYVTEIADNAFKNVTSITSITFADGSPVQTMAPVKTAVASGSMLTKIGANAFYGCSNLKTIEIPAGVTSIGTNAFYNCSKLESVIISDVNAWAEINFSDYLSNPAQKSKNLYLNSVASESLIKQINLSTATKVSNYAFYNVQSIEEVVFGENVTTVGSRAFYNCQGITVINLGNSIRSIGSYGFANCSNLASVTLPINSSFTEISEGLFANCSSLLSITIPESVTSVKINAFNEDSSIKHVITNNINSWAEIEFANEYANPVRYATKLYLNDASTEDNVITEINLTSATKVGAYAFAYCQDLTKITIGTSVQTIKTHAFWFCKNVTDLTMLNGVTKINSYAFLACHGLTSVVIPNSVTELGEYSFNNCDNLSTVTLGNSVAKIGNNAFYDSGSNLKTINVTNSVPATIGSLAFSTNHSSFRIVVPYSGFEDHMLTWVTYDDYIAIDSAEGIFTYGTTTATNDTVTGLKSGITESNIVIPTKVVVSDSVYSISNIGSSAFKAKTNITRLRMFDNITTLGAKACYNCGNLETLILSENITVISEEAFYSCEKLNGVEFGENLTTIGNKAFYECASIKEITIPKNVTSISSSAFRYCSWLETINYNAEAVVDRTITEEEKEDGTTETTIEYIFNDSNLDLSTLTTIYTPLFQESGVSSGGITVNIGSDVSYIPAYIFRDLTTLKAVNFEARTKDITIERNAFYNCSGLTSITLPEQLTRLGSSSFYDCTGLTEINFNAKACADLDSSDWVFFNAGMNSSGIKVTIGKNVKQIPAYLFSGKGYRIISLNETIVYDDLPRNMIRSVEFEQYAQCESINECAFRYCPYLAKITIPNLIKTIQDDAFAYAYNLTEINYNAIGCTDFDSNNFIFNSAGTSGSGITVTFGAGVYRIPSYLFYSEDEESLGVDIKEFKTPKIKNLLFVSDTTEEGDGKAAIFGEKAFYNCSGLTKIQIPNRETTIGDDCFTGCSGITILDIGMGLNNDGVSKTQFNGCNSLKELYTNSYISANGFEGLTSLQLVMIFDNVTRIASHVFNGCSNLLRVSLPESIINIGSYAFYGCSALPFLTIHNGVKTILNYAFSYCTSLTEINIPSSVTSIGSYAFSECSNLEEIKLTDNIQIIGNEVFLNCVKLKGNIRMPMDLSTVGKDIFKNCSQSLTLETYYSAQEISGFDWWNNEWLNGFNGTVRYAQITISIIEIEYLRNGESKNVNRLYSVSYDSENEKFNIITSDIGADNVIRFEDVNGESCVYYGDDFTSDFDGAGTTTTYTQTGWVSSIRDGVLKYEAYYREETEFDGSYQ